MTYKSHCALQALDDGLDKCSAVALAFVHNPGQLCALGAGLAEVNDGHGLAVPAGTFGEAVRRVDLEGCLAMVRE